MSNRRKSGLIAVAAAAALGGGGAAIAGAAGGDDDATDRAITGPALDRAGAAALNHTGGGRVTETEIGDEEGAYEVEVTRANGSQVDVHLNRDFKVISQASDDDRGGEQDERGDD